MKADLVEPRSHAVQRGSTLLGGTHDDIRPRNKEE
jgi:hypothetical protein